MSVIKPFCAVRPKKEFASLVAALPYDVMNSAEAREKVKGAPYSFIHVDKAVASGEYQIAFYPVETQTESIYEYFASYTP